MLDVHPNSGPILYFDGLCHFCDRSIQFVLKHESGQYLRFAPIQGSAGQKVNSLLPPGTDALILEEDGHLFMGSDAALKLARHLKLPYRLFASLFWIPRFLREPVYRWLAKNRYRWFGKKSSCTRPSPGWEKRFLE